MAHNIFGLLHNYLLQYGYWAVAGCLLLENTGVPVPGETVLLLAGFMAYSHQQLRLPWLIAVGTLAATFGDNLGYAIGHHGGRPLLEGYQHFFHIPSRVLQRGDRLFARYGSFAVFFARFVFGMRIITGPLAGVLCMPWRSFVLFNFLGAALWVAVISLLGYLLGRHWSTLVRYVGRMDVFFVVAAVALVVLLWRRQRARPAGG